MNPFAMAGVRPNFRIGDFTKELQSLSYEETADAVFKMGWDGIECPVRPGGHVLPENFRFRWSGYHTF